MTDMNRRNSSVDALFETVVAGGYCIGCGACAAAKPGEITTGLDRFGRIQAVRTDEPPAERTPGSIDAEAVCPFSRSATDEDQIGRRLFAAGSNHTPKVGFWSALYAGYVTEQGYRSNGSSGGMGSWIPAELLRLGLVDAVLHVKPARNPDSGLIFEYQVSRTVEEVRAGAKSRYYPCDLREVIGYVRDTPGRYALIALPCFSKAVRLLAASDKVAADRLRFVIALVCGHLKSTAYARMYAWQSGVEPESLRHIDFRHKGPGLTAKHYFVAIEAERSDGPVRSVTDNKEFFGTDWGHGFFKYTACDYCDDVLGETADIAIGDAWLKQYDRDPGGTNIVVLRNRALVPIFETAMAERRIWIEPLRTDDVIRSQLAGFRHRHEGLAYRLWLKDRRGVWRPPKRIAPGKSHLAWYDRVLFRLRETIRDKSHDAFLQAVERRDLRLFLRQMKLLLVPYRLLYCGRRLKEWKRRIVRRRRGLAAKPIAPSSARPAGGRSPVKHRDR